MNSLKDYGDLFERLGLSELSVEEGEFRLTLKKKISVNTKESIKTEERIIPENNPAEDKKEPAGVEIKAPLLGIFYGKVGDKEPLKVGDKVKKGQCLCTIEAMKMLNEVTSSTDGEIKKINASDGDLVEYNQTLFVIG